MKSTERDVQNLAEWLQEARSRTGLSREKVAEAIKAAAEGDPEKEVSARTIYEYEAGRIQIGTVVPQKLRQLVNWYRWAPGSLARVLAGGEPEYRDEYVRTAKATIPEIPDGEEQEVLRLVKSMSKGQRDRVLKALRERGDREL